ncbi:MULTISPECIES: murein L,D-transpeptidase catalytic domain family protein [Fusobacterium]|uniref:Murein L,D-transpeptidase catalytic domain family protein n=1 Tax=Fusobacterium nucleatum TaxID=851 RepID=A0AAX3M8V8_FUSNU|nr:murein L,D-transpeptidase catalytic domain family protein [Fusobacterium nucleatum]WDA43060.1 murein L,D-transpeptidase catalytic domain family protein [Fusobacterium nucleatum]
MKLLKYVFSLIIYFIFSLSLFAEINFSNDFKLSIKKNFSDMDIKLMYTELCLNDKVSFSCFNNAMHGLEKIEDLEIFDNSNNNLLVMVDYTKPSTEERLFIIDLRKKQLLISSLVTHGRGTGDLYATKFSNKNNSYSTSSGFYLTGNIYNGKHGESLELYGLEKGKNDNAKKRTIVMHSAYYANKAFAEKYGRLGRSKGCLALPTDLNAKIINLISGGVVLYVHTNFDENKEYDFSKLLSKSF